MVSRSSEDAHPRAGVRAPYPGPRSFRREESELFFGRGRERTLLRSLVLAHSLVLLYGQSGSGKSSLIEAGLVGDLRARQATVFPTARIRGDGTGPGAGSAANPFVAALIGYVCGVTPELAAPLAGVSDLAGLVAALADVYGAPDDEPRVLIIDQFEELFTAFPESWERRGEFFEQLQQAVDADSELRVLLVLREDQLGQTDPYAPLLTGHLHHRFRLERLGPDGALAAVTKPLADTDRAFAPGAARYLVDRLLDIRVERDGRVDRGRGEYVEPVQLQIVCTSLWQRLEAPPAHVGEITTEDIDRYADVDQALSRFYDTVIELVSGAAGVDARTLRTWCEDQLITAGGTRALVYRGVTSTEGMPNSVVDRLEGEHLIRGEERAGARWYELSHDTFIAAIQTANRRAAERELTAARSRRSRWRRRLTISIPCTVGIIVALIAYATKPNPLQTLERSTIDVRFAVRGTVEPSGVMIVAIDRRTRAALAAGTPPIIPRADDARAIDAVWRGRPAAIAVDLLYTDQRAGDSQLLAAFRQTGGRVAVVANALNICGQTELFGVTVNTPYSDSRGVCKGAEPASALGAQVGFVAFTADPDGELRRFPWSTGLREGVARIRALPVVAAQTAGHEVARFGSAWLDYAGGPGTFPRVSLLDVLDGRVAPDRFRNKIVLIGETLPGVDQHGTPAAGGSTMYGVEILANATWTVLRGLPLGSSAILDVAVVILLGLLPVVMVRFGRPTAVIVWVAAAAIFLIAVQVLFEGGLILSVVYPLISLLLAPVLVGAALLADGKGSGSAAGAE